MTIEVLDTAEIAQVAGGTTIYGPNGGWVDFHDNGNGTTTTTSHWVDNDGNEHISQRTTRNQYA